MSRAVGNGHDSPPNATYGFIAIGVMGAGMARNVGAKIPSSSKLLVCDKDSARVAEFCSKATGLVVAASSPKEIMQECEIIIVSIPAGPAVEDVWRDPSHGMLAAQPDGRSRLVIDTSSIPVRQSLELRKQVVDSGLGDFVDAPISGGIPAAENGDLVFMVGGTKAELDRAKPILRTMAQPSKIFHCGPAGAGMAAKIINNYIATASYVALCEGMNTGVRYGLDTKVLTDVINTSSGMSWNSLHMNPVKGVQTTASASRDFEGGASRSLVVHSTEMAVELMEQVNAKYLMAPVLRDLWARAGKSPHCIGKEYRSVYRLFSEDDGCALGTVSVE